MNIHGIIMGCLRWLKSITKGIKKETTPKEPMEVMLDMLRRNNNPWVEDITMSLAYNIMRDIALHLVKKHKKEYTESLIHDGIYKNGSETLMLALLLNKFTWYQVATGKYHLYRGILNTTGEQLEKLFYSTMNMLTDAELLDEKMADSWSKTFIEDVACIG